VLEKTAPTVARSTCVTGTRACPPEDCGGVWGTQSCWRPSPTRPMSSTRNSPNGWRTSTACPISTPPPSTSPRPTSGSPLCSAKPLRPRRPARPAPGLVVGLLWAGFSGFRTRSWTATVHGRRSRAASPYMYRRHRPPRSPASRRTVRGLRCTWLTAAHPSKRDLGGDASVARGIVDPLTPRFSPRPTNAEREPALTVRAYGGEGRGRTGGRRWCGRRRRSCRGPRRPGRSRGGRRRTGTAAAGRPPVRRRSHRSSGRA
jgi:hypothetical protein